MTENLNAALFVLGFVVWTVGIARAWSSPAACIAAGFVVMVLALYPYLKARKP